MQLTSYQLKNLDFLLLQTVLRIMHSLPPLLPFQANNKNWPISLRMNFRSFSLDLMVVAHATLWKFLSDWFQRKNDLGKEYAWQKEASSLMWMRIFDFTLSEWLLKESRWLSPKKKTWRKWNGKLKTLSAPTGILNTTGKVSRCTTLLREIKIGSQWNMHLGLRG